MNTQAHKFIDELLTLISRGESGEKVGGLTLAKIIKKITELEIEEGGPYSFEPVKGERHVDVGLNLAVACFLVQQDIRLPKLNVFLEKRIASLQESSDSVISANIVTELIDKYQAGIAGGPKEDSARKPIGYDASEEKIISLIWLKFNERFSTFSPEVRERARGAIEKTIRGNRDKQMSLMAYYMRNALGKAGADITEDLVAEMGLANIFFWTAFIIYDDFWDRDESADPKLLPIANIFARHYTDYFLNLLPDISGFRSFFHKLMDDLDAANVWETEHCRAQVEGTIFHIPKKLPEYGDYENEYRPASGHILGPLALLAGQGYGPDTEEAKNFIAYFRHYLIAMQLNDDAHDWEEDLARGHLSTVVTLLLKDMKEAGWKGQTIDLENDLAELKKIFWFKTMPKYVEATLAHTVRSREALRALSIVENPVPLERIINMTEDVAQTAAKEQANADALLTEFNIWPKKRNRAIQFP